MLDVHILQHPEYRGWKVGRCLESCYSDRAHVHLLEGYPGHIGRGRVEGFSRGSQPFVTYVDDDDMVTPGTLDILVTLLEETPEAAMAYVFNKRADEAAQIPPAQSTAEYRITTKRRFDYFCDHMCVYRRDRLQGLLPEYQRWRRGGDSRIMRKYVDYKVMPDEPVIVVTQPLYRYCKDL